MKKIFKIPLQILSALLLFLVVIPMLLAVLLQINGIQNVVVKKLAGWVSEKLETTVTIDRVHLSFFYQARFQGLYVQSPVNEADTLLYAAQLTAGIRKIDLVNGGIHLGTVRMKNAKFYLLEDSTGVLNLKYVTEKLKNDREEKKDFLLTIAAVNIDTMDFRFRKNTPRPRDFGVNFDDMRFRDMKLVAQHFSIHNDSISMRLSRLTFTDQGGLYMKHLASKHLSVTPRAIALRDARVELGQTMLDVNEISLNYNGWEEMSEFTEKVRLRLDANNSRVGFRDLNYFTGKNDPWTAVLDFKGKAEGPIGNLTGVLTGIRTSETTIARVGFHITGLPQIKQALFDLEVTGMQSSAANAGVVYQNFTDKSIDNIVYTLRNLQSIVLSGNFRGLLRDFYADADISTNLGAVRVNLQLQPSQDVSMLMEGNVDVMNFNLGGLTETPKLGNVSLTAHVDGIVSNQDIRLRTTASVNELGFNDYPYSHIQLSGAFVNKTFRGNVLSDDPNLKMEIEGFFDLTDTIPAYEFRMDLERADLAKLRFNHRDSISVLGGQLVAHGMGADIDDINGTIVIDNLNYVNHIDTINTGQIVFLANNSPMNKRITMTSDFADAEIQGKQSYRHILPYFTNTLRLYLPSLPEEALGWSRSEAREQRQQAGRRSGRRSRTRFDAAIDSALNAYYLIKVDVKEANNVAAIFVPGLNVAQGSNLSFLFNPGLNQFSINGRSDYITSENIGAANINIDARNQADSVSLFVRAEEVEVSGIYLPNLSVIGSLRNNEINLSSRFQNHQDSSNALIITRSVFRRNASTGIPELMVNVRPSYFSIGRQTWNIDNNRILIDSTGVDIREFSITREGQRLVIDGKASYSLSDTLNIQVDNFDLRPLSGITRRMGYQVNGKLSGGGRIFSALKNPLLYAGFRFTDLSVNDTQIPDLALLSRWIDQQETMQYVLFSQSDTIVTGGYAIREKEFDMDVRIKRLDLSLLDPLLTDIVSRTSGTADAKLNFSNKNPRKRAFLNGTIDVADLSFMVDFTKVRYRLPEAVIDINDNVLKFRRNRLLDYYGAGGDFDASLDLNDLKNLRFDIEVRPERMLALNTTIRDNDLFYGKAFASGVVAIHGVSNDIKMTINASTQNQSEFFLPLSDQATIEEADFITFIDGAAPPDQQPVSRKFSLRDRREKKEIVPNKSFDINMTLEVSPNTEAQIVIDPTVGDVIRAKGRGTLFLNINPPKDIFTLSGTYTIEEGNYLFTLKNFFNRRFIIESGSTIQWNGDPLEALLNITAVYRVKASLAPLFGSGESSVNYNRNVNVDCSIILTDNLMHPDIQLGINVPGLDVETQSQVQNALNTEESVSMQFLSLLVMNSFYAENNDMNIGANTAMVTGIEFLSNQLTNWISNDKFNIGINYRPRNEISSDEIGLEYSQNLFNNRLLLEVEGNYNTNNNISPNSQNANSLTGNFYLTWVLDRSGNLRAKGFTRTIDTFDENYGLLEHGVGIYYKKDFNTLSQLMRDRRLRAQQRKLKREQKKQQPVSETSDNEPQPSENDEIQATED